MKILDPNLKDGVHEWRDGKRFVKEGDRLYLEGTDTLAGRSVSSRCTSQPLAHLPCSVVTLDKCVRNFVRFTGCSIGDSIKCATYNPAKCVVVLMDPLAISEFPSRCLGIENRKGTLRAGADADFVVLDRLGHPLQTWVGGKQVWAKQQ